MPNAVARPDLLLVGRLNLAASVDHLPPRRRLATEIRYGNRCCTVTKGVEQVSFAGF